MPSSFCTPRARLVQAGRSTESVSGSMTGTNELARIKVDCRFVTFFEVRNTFFMFGKDVSIMDRPFAMYLLYAIPIECKAAAITAVSR